MEKNEIDTRDGFVRDEREQCVLHLFSVENNGALILFIFFLSEFNWNCGSFVFTKLIGTFGEIFRLDIGSAKLSHSGHD